MSVAALLLAAGSSRRMNNHVKDKMLVSLVGKPVFQYSVEAFLKSEVADTFVITYRDPAQKQTLEKIVDSLALPESISVFWAQGGKERQDSVLNGLNALPETVETVFIHDCSRPLVKASTLQKLLKTVQKDKAAVLCHKVVNTIKQAPERLEDQPNYLTDLPRDELWAMETPQVFDRTLIHEAYQKTAGSNEVLTDDVSAATLSHHRVTLVPNLDANPKLTIPADFAYAEFLLQQTGPIQFAMHVLEEPTAKKSVQQPSRTRS